VTPAAAEIAADPVAVIAGLVAAAVHDLDEGQVRDVVLAVAGGRAKARRIAAALAARPGVLGDGLSPAPRAIADLLIGLRKAGAGAVSAPRCARCRKPLRTFQRRGQDWYCAVCASWPAPCAACGQTRRVSTRDRAGRPRCGQCPDDGSRDPVAVIIALITAIDPAADPVIIAATVRRAAPRPSHQRKLAWALESHPELLTGSGHLTPVPAVLRLIGLLNDSGITAVAAPACPRCHRQVPVSKALDGQRICRGCSARARTEQCSRCGAIREPATRDEHGRPLCPNCLITDPANLETCLNCGRRRPVSTRTPQGAICPTCPPLLPVLTCSICGLGSPCGISRLTGQPWCVTCQRRRARCTGCGRDTAIRSGTLEQPLCGACTIPEFNLGCPACGASRVPGQCPDCRLSRRLAELLTGPGGAVHPALRPLNQALAAAGRPEIALRWLGRDLVAELLDDLASGRREPTHAELDSLPPGPVLAHFRSVLVATGTLPPRDENLARLERLLSEIVAARADPDQRELLHRYAIWHLLRRLRHRARGQDVTHEQETVVRQRVRAAAGFLDWLTTQHRTLADCRQGDLDRWLTEGHALNRQQAGSFIRWASRNRLTTLDFPATRWHGPARPMDDQARWDAARRLLHDDAISTRDRIAGLLVVLYAQPTARISRLTTSHIETSGTQITIRFGQAPITLPGPVAGLIRQFLAGPRGHAATGAGKPSPWLFPGGQPGRPVSAGHLGQRLKDIGIQPGPTRSTALFQLATELPAAILARMLGIHIDVAVAWQHASSGDWAAYAAAVSRRPHNP
jgi:hypothetical protein